VIELQAWPTALGASRTATPKGWSSHSTREKLQRPDVSPKPGRNGSNAWVNGKLRDEARATTGLSWMHSMPSGKGGHAQRPSSARARDIGHPDLRPDLAPRLVQLDAHQVADRSWA
jgi:hypothetical protein